ncbi:hypothetical protein CR513_25399, partial [Mucuna pruriens]
MPPNLRLKFVQLLKEYADVFAWSYRDMPGLDREIVEHKLPLLLGSVLVRQQLRRMRQEVALKIKEEVEKQWNTGFMAVANYPQWVANIVPVPKKDGKVRMCIDYKDLNRASPKDNFPLPYIDGTFCYKVMSFGLKNAGATYQRAMVALFHDMMHKEDLRKLFTRLQKYKLRLNPAKCTFGVKTGKLLGFVVNERGIEMDPDKVKAIREMLVPKIE